MKRHVDRSYLAIVVLLMLVLPLASLLTDFDWIGLAFLILFVARWIFLEYVTFSGIETGFRRLVKWWKRR